MFKNSGSFLPQIINAVSENDQPKDLKHIISHVREQLNLEGENVKNVSTDVRSGIALGLEYGIISGNRNAYKLAVNLDPKPKDVKVVAPKNVEPSATSIVDEDGSEINDPNNIPVKAAKARGKHSRGHKRSRSHRSRSRSKRSKKRSKRRKR